LVIVDAQVDMFDPADPVRDGERVLAVLVALIERARESGTPVIYIQHNGSQGSGLARGTAGWPIHPRLEPSPGDWVIEKSEPDSFQGTELDALLRRHGIARLVIAGMLTEYCLDTTVRSAFGRGYSVVLVEDGHATCDSDSLTAEQIVAHHNRTLQRFADVRKASEIEL
jgi:nicotinamidase-related amidase